jgi:hypothetical protein
MRDAACSISRNGEVMPRASTRTMSKEITMAIGGRNHTMPSCSPIWLTTAPTPPRSR